MDTVFQGVTEMDSWTGNNHILVNDSVNTGGSLEFVKTDLPRLQELLGPGSWGGVNTVQSNGRYIAMLDWNETNSDANWQQKQIVKHELAHNFDTVEERFGLMAQRHPTWAQGFGAIQLAGILNWQWVGQSSWQPGDQVPFTDSNFATRSSWSSLMGHPASQMTTSGDGKWSYLASLTDANFAREYGRYNMFEDWTTTIELYSTLVAGRGGSNWKSTYAGMISKLKFVDAFFVLVDNDEAPTSGNLFSMTDLQDYFSHVYTVATGYHGMRAPS
jgi:hypothetical protein